MATIRLSNCHTDLHGDLVLTTSEKQSTTNLRKNDAAYTALKPRPNLFEPLKLRDITLRNRIAVSPMCQYSSENGVASDWHLVHLGSRAIGGAALIIAEATGVEARGRITPGCAGLWNDDQIVPLKRITNFLKEYGAVPGIQLAHAGRKASAARPWDGGASLSDAEGGWETIGPSATAFGGRLTRAPREMTLDDIKEVKQAFRFATVRALAAGYELVELHAAHGYLLHSFYSPLVNQRTDQYGGSFDNRIRFTLETAKEMREVWPQNLPMAVRISCSDWTEDGWNIDDSIELSRRLKQLGVDLIDCSSSNGDRTNKNVPFGPGFQVPFAESIRRESDIASGAVGMITDPAQADEIIRNGRADIVLLAREFLREPYWAVNAGKKLKYAEATKLPTQYDFWIK
jgi:2,4-dienoyl-CoA reductase-like NADH-dependent reductase (Old Yellow Enzyme family)